jgi:hypothetical protein
VEWCDRFSYSGSLTDGLINDKYDEMRTSWFRKKEWFHRIGLYDEVYEGASGDESGDERWHEVERLYRQLKRNYEERGDFPRGGDFHIGEKEARRQGNNRWGPRLLLNTYRALSKYGERALPAFSWLLALVPIFALIYFLLGASTCPLCEPSYPDALISSLEATLYPVRPVGFEDFWPQIFSIVQRIISPILIALLALALRQRVKR